MPKGYHHVTRDIRSQIYALKSTGTSLRKIATIVGKHASSISREIERNTGGRGYRYKQADIKAIERRAKASHTPKKLTPPLILESGQNRMKKASCDFVQIMSDKLNDVNFGLTCPLGWVG